MIDSHVLFVVHLMATGHMNPAVSLALMLNGRITIFRAICYWGKFLI